MRTDSLSTLRLVLPSLLSVVSVAALVGAGVLGCSVQMVPSEVDPDETASDDEPVKKKDTSPTDPAPISSVTPPASSTTPPVVIPPVVLPPVTPPPPPATTTPPPPPPTKCLATSLHESEPNDTDATANELGAATSVCGTISPGEVDYVAFTLPADAKGFSYGASWDGFGNPTITLTSEGVTTSPPQAPPFNLGKRYVFKVVGGTSKLDYVISLNIAR